MYKRRIRLTATDFESGEEVFSTESHRITFEVDVNIAQGISNSTIVIYNLADAEVKALTRTDIEPISEGDGKDNRPLKKIRVRLHAGYEDEIEGDFKVEQLLIEGYIMNATSLKRLPNRLTYLYVIAFGSNFLINKFESFTTPGFSKPNEQMTLKEVINKITESAGYAKGAVDYTSVPEELVGELTKPAIRGRTFTNTSRGMFTVLDNLAAEFSFSWGVRVNGIGIYPILKDSQKDSTEFNFLRNGRPFKIDPVRVRGTPIAGVATLEIPHKLDATIFPGLLIDIGEINGNGDNDSLPDNGIIDYTAIGKEIFHTNDVSKYGIHQNYMVFRVVHKGDTHGQDWQSTLVCKTPSSGITSDKET